MASCPVSPTCLMYNEMSASPSTQPQHCPCSCPQKAIHKHTQVEHEDHRSMQGRSVLQPETPVDYCPLHRESIELPQDVSAKNDRILPGNICCSILLPAIAAKLLARSKSCPAAILDLPRDATHMPLAYVRMAGPEHSDTLIKIQTSDQKSCNLCQDKC